MGFRPVSFELEQGIDISGAFSTVLCGTDYRFEWTPDPKSGMIDSDLPIERFKIIIRLCELSSIIKRDESMVTVSLYFTMKDNSKLPPFKFHYCAPQLTHLMEFLEYKHLISKSLNDQNKYSVAIPFAKLAVRIPSKSYIKTKDAFHLAKHKAIVKEMTQKLPITNGTNTMTLNDVKTFFREDGVCRNFAKLKSEVRTRGLTDEARNFLWPYLLNVKRHDKTYDDNKRLQSMRLEEYKVIKRQWNSFTEEQKANVRAISELIRVVANDVKRNDRGLPQFADENGPYLRTLNDVLVTYGAYNKDCGYVQGMGDIISPVLLLYVTDWQDSDHAVLWDKSVVDRIAVESEMMWILDGILTVTHHEQLFTDMSKNQRFVLERVLSIARVHEPLKEWLMHSDCEEPLLFLYRPYLLLYKRDFGMDLITRIWDSFFAAENPTYFHRYFTAAILILLYPQLLLNTNGSLGEVVQMADGTIKTLDPLLALNMASYLHNDKTHDTADMERLEVPSQREELIDYIPAFLKIN